jgi:hypothetical protein
MATKTKKPRRSPFSTGIAGLRKPRKGGDGKLPISPPGPGKKPKVVQYEDLSWQFENKPPKPKVKKGPKPKNKK